MPVISVQKLIGLGYNKIWFTNCRARYRLLPGSRNSKKSHNIMGYEPIIKILSSNERNIVMFRANDVDNAESCYANLVQKIEELGLSHLFKCTTSPYKITKKSTGQVILFRGMSNPTSLTSLKATTGIFTDFYFEEASELESYEDFRKVDGSLRGIPKDGSALQIVFCFNPWSIDHWLYEIFCKDRQMLDEKLLETQGWQLYEEPDFNLGYGKGLAIFTTSYKVNEFRSPDYDEGMESLKKASYDIYKTEGLGMWGNTGEATYPDFKPELIIDTFKINSLRPVHFAIGVDVGISDGAGHLIKSDGTVRSATTMCLVGVVDDKIIVFDEFFYTNVGVRVPKTEPEIEGLMCEKLKYWSDRFYFVKTGRARIFIDSASPGFAQTLRDMARNRYGLFNFTFELSTKLKIHNRINFTNYLMAFGELNIASTCTNLIREIKNAKKGKNGEPRGANGDHSIDAMDYASTPLWGHLRRARTYKFLDGDEKKVIK